MRARLNLAALLSAVIGALVSGCFEPKHPDHARYEYMYIHGIFQPPYTTFPAGIERGDWKCFDENIQKEFDCTFVRGGWNQYHYIYRTRR
ncbi:MAG: hypothetical protein WD207_06345 [Xanthobacteraceae bacterium]